LVPVKYNEQNELLTQACASYRCDDWDNQFSMRMRLDLHSTPLHNSPGTGTQIPMR
jgi:hypothetical protein